MNRGVTISGVGHLGLILWVLFGGLFLRPQDQAAPTVTQVQILTGAEFAQLSAAANPPAADPAAPEPLSPTEPVVEPAPDPQPEAQPEPAPQPEPQPEPPVTPEVQPDSQPVPEPLPEPVPEPVPGPVVEPVPEPAVEPVAEPVVQPPELAVSPRPKLRPVPRVAPVAAEAPPPDTQVSDTVQEAVTADAPADATVPDQPQEATAPEEAATEIVPETPEVVEASAAPASSSRPKSRPERAAAAVATAAETTTEQTAADSGADPATGQTDPQADEILAALQDVQGGTVDDGGSDAQTTPEAPPGPKLTSGELEGLRVAIEKCWNVGALSSEALRMSVTIKFLMTAEGRPDAGSITLVDFVGGSEEAARAAFEVGRRAIIRCGSEGFQLPAEKYEDWKDVTAIFDLTQMRF